jgi:hemoglobin-like flavoprotein
MSVSAYQKMLVEKTFRTIANNAEAVAGTFYRRLFELDPSLRHLFKADLKTQGKMLMQMIAVAVTSLNDLDTLVPAVQALGARHVNYGVKKEDYQTVGSALLWTLEHYLGAEFTPEVKEAWTAVYVLLAETATENAYMVAAVPNVSPS